MFEREPAVTDETAATQFASGELVWVNGRPALFCYSGGSGAAVVRFRGEDVTRVVPARKLTAAPPPRT